MRLDWGWVLFEDWTAAADPDDIPLAAEALFSLTDDTWADRYQHYDDVTSDKRQIILVVRPGLWLVAWQHPDHPDLFNLVYLGSPDDY